MQNCLGCSQKKSATQIRISNFLPAQTEYRENPSTEPREKVCESRTCRKKNGNTHINTRSAFKCVCVPHSKDIWLCVQLSIWAWFLHLSFAGHKRKCGKGIHGMPGARLSSLALPHFLRFPYCLTPSALHSFPGCWKSLLKFQALLTLLRTQKDENI